MITAVITRVGIRQTLVLCWAPCEGPHRRYPISFSGLQTSKEAGTFLMLSAEENTQTWTRIPQLIVLVRGKMGVCDSKLMFLNFCV